LKIFQEQRDSGYSSVHGTNVSFILCTQKSKYLKH
jgi:hypothetical protein